MDQRNYSKMYYYVIIAEFVILIAIAVLANAWLWMTTAQRKAIHFLYKGTVRATFIITLLVLAETLWFYLYQKHGHMCGLATQGKFIITFLEALRYSVFILFIAYHILFRVFAAREGLVQGTDTYMAYLRPGAVIAFLPIVGIEIVFGVINSGLSSR